MAKRRAAAGTGSIRKKTRTNPSGRTYTYWEARYSLGFDPKTGKQIQKSITGKTQKEVAQKLRSILTSIDTGSYREPCEMTLGAWMDTWLKEYLTHTKPLTQKTYFELVKKHIKPELGTIQLGALDTHTIQRFYNSLTEAGLSPKSIKNIHGVLHSALQQSLANNYITVNPTNACKLPRIVKPEIRPLEPEEIKSLLREAQLDDYCNLFIAALFTGMRQGELLGLSWDYVNFETGVITVRQQLQCKDGEYFLETPKNGKGRTILPAPMVMDALRKEKEKQQAAKDYAGACFQNPWNLVFTDALGKHLVRRTVVKHFKKVAKRAGVEESRFHDLRHTFAVTSLYAGDDIKSVQANLGHATAQFTLDVYGHVTQKMRQESADRMQKFYDQLYKE